MFVLNIFQIDFALQQKNCKNFFGQLAFTILIQDIGITEISLLTDRCPNKILIEFLLMPEL